MFGGRWVDNHHSGIFTWDVWEDITSNHNYLGGSDDGLGYISLEIMIPLGIHILVRVGLTVHILDSLHGICNMKLDLITHM